MRHEGSAPEIRRLGILGGSFDPVHVAHLVVAESVRETLRLDMVLFVPTGLQPLKTNRIMSPAQHRVAMVELAIEGNPHFSLSRTDVYHPGPSYTAETLQRLRKEWGMGVEMWFILGSDSLATFPAWHEPAAILEQARLAVVRRPGTTLDTSALESALPQIAEIIDWVDAPLLEISATDLRRRVAEGLSIRYRVPDSVRQYIEVHSLYHS